MLPAGPEELIRNSADNERTRTATDIEQVLGALSMLLNGGGLAQLTPIVDELNKALGTDGSELKSLLKTTSKLVAGLNRQRDDIVTAIDGLNQLSERTVAQTDQIDRILGELPRRCRFWRISGRSSSICSPSSIGSEMSAPTSSPSRVRR